MSHSLSFKTVTGFAVLLASAAAAPTQAAGAVPAPAKAPPRPTPIERRLILDVAVEGDQAWRNELQWAKGKTSQHYELNIQLRSDGRLYTENLLELDQTKRMTIKKEYLTLRGLETLKRENGGKLPASAGDIQAFANSAQSRTMDCRGEGECVGALAERFAAMGALQENTVEELEAWIAEADQQVNGRYQYFHGFSGCANQIHIAHSAHIEGMQAFDKNKKNLVPYRLDRSADTRGAQPELGSLCHRYLVTVDSKTGDIYVENAYMPSAQGTEVMVSGEVTNRKQMALPVPVQVLDWTSAQLRKAKDSGTETSSQAFTRPLDGNASVMGDFTGTLKTTLTWSFKPDKPAPR